MAAQVSEGPTTNSNVCKHLAADEEVEERTNRSAASGGGGDLRIRIVSGVVLVFFEET